MIGKIVSNTSLILSSGLVVGFFIPQFSMHAEALLIPALMLALTISLRKISFDQQLLSDWKNGVKAYFLSLLMGVFTILFALFFITNPDYRTGFIVMAFIPPAVGVIAFTYLLRGDGKLSLIGSSIAYISSILITPFCVWYFTGGVIDPLYILEIVLLLLLVPMILSRFLKYFPFNFEKNSKPLVNICFFIVTYAMIALNHDEIVAQGIRLLPVFIVLFMRTHFTGFLTYGLLRNRIDRQSAVTYSLFASFKNGGMATVVTYYLFGAAASIPAALSALFEISYVLGLEQVSKKDQPA